MKSNLVCVTPDNVTIAICRHEVADVAGLTSFSFGEDEVDRYVMIWKKVLLQDIKCSRTKIVQTCKQLYWFLLLYKEFAPTDEELAAYRRGEEWDAEKAKQEAKLKVTNACLWQLRSPHPHT